MFHDLDPAQVRTPEVFVHVLSQVRDRAGLSYAKLERFGSPDVPLSKGTLSGIFSGKRLPSVDQLAVILTGCGIPAYEVPAWIKALVRLKAVERGRTRGHLRQAGSKPTAENAEQLTDRLAELSMLVEAEETKIRHLSQYLDRLRREPDQAPAVKQFEADLDREHNRRAQLLTEIMTTSKHLDTVDDRHHLDARDVQRCPLPPTDRIFAGRDTLIEAIGTPQSLWLSGRPGVGTSQVAIHWAHRVASSYERVLYLDLQGMTPGRRVSASHAARKLAGALSRDSVGEGDDDEELFDLLQDRLGSTRALVVLDNAHDAGHVEPLLRVAASGTTVVVTSRNRRQAFTREAVHVPVLARADAVTLLSGFAPGTDPAVLDSIADLCDDLPLALRIVAGLIVGKPPQFVPVIARNLADERQRLNHLATDQQAVRSAIMLSYESLPAGAQRAARRLALSFAATSDAAEMAVGLGTDENTTTLDLLRVVDASLADVSVDGDHLTYSLPPLIWLALAERSSSEDDWASVTDYLMRTAQYVTNLATDVAEAGGKITDLARARVILQAAVSNRWWQIAEDLVRALRRLLAGGRDQERFEITEMLVRSYLADGKFEQAIEASIGMAQELQEDAPHRTAAREWAERAGAFAKRYDMPRLQIKAGMVLSTILATEEDFQAALRIAESLLPITRSHLAPSEQHNPIFNLARLYSAQGNHEEASKHFGQLIQLAELVGDARNHAEACHFYGNTVIRLGDIAQAVTSLRKAAYYWATTGYHHNAAMAHQAIANIATEPGERIAAQEEAVARWRMTSDSGRLSDALVNLAALYYGAGRLDDTEQTLEHAAALTGDDRPDLDHEIATRIAALAVIRGRPASPPPDQASAHHLIAEACRSMKPRGDTASPDRLLRQNVLHPVPAPTFWLHDDSRMPSNPNILEA
ncbi:NB-ARC domain-containing protein [Amycolatopsis sp. NPDC024027]|uniref:NB-ARC domain-containing protein n=1 Tax=Amycolatopsis sp. NPDC024027 TaxID=3154327 RepID=UPI0033EE2293